jgi:hypothetical protein
LRRSVGRRRPRGTRRSRSGKSHSSRACCTSRPRSAAPPDRSSHQGGTTRRSRSPSRIAEKPHAVSLSRTLTLQVIVP